MKKIMKHIKSAILVLLWNLPLLWILLTYTFAYIKLIFIQSTEFKIAATYQETQTAISITIWLYQHFWIFLVFAIASNSIYLFLPRKKPFSYFRWAIFIIMLMLSLRYGGLLLHFSGRLLTL